MTTNTPLAAPSQSEFEYNNLSVIFAPAFTGKTSLIATAFAPHLTPPDASVYMLALDPNSVSGIDAGLKHYGVTLKPGQLFVATPKRTEGRLGNVLRALTKTASTKAKVDQKSQEKNSAEGKALVSRMEAIAGLLETFEGVDWATKKPSPKVDTEKIGSNSILVIDSWTAFVLELSNWINQENLLQPERSGWGQMNNAVSNILSVLASLPCKVVILTHCNEESREKPKEGNKPPEVALYEITPVMGVTQKNKDSGHFACANTLFLKRSAKNAQIVTKEWEKWGDPRAFTRAATINNSHTALKVTIDEKEYALPKSTFSLAQLFWGKPLDVK